MKLPVGQPGRIAGLAAAYFVAGKLGLTLAFVHPSATAVWPPTGIALAALLLGGSSLWPGVLLGAFLVNLTTAGGPVVSLAIAGGNTLEALVGARLVRRFAHGQLAFDHPQDVVAFTLLAALGSTAIAATVGTASLLVGGVAPWWSALPIWVTWWLGDAGGDMVVAPLILLAATPVIGIEWDHRHKAEAVLLALLTVLSAQLVFGTPLEQQVAHGYPLDFLVMPVLVWAAFRFGRRGAAAAVALMYVVAVYWTLRGAGPFAAMPSNDALILLQIFTIVAGVTALTLAAVVLERRRVEHRLLQLSASDPLTGLANHRRLMEVLEAEVERSLRTGRPFGVIFLDVDDLKGLNDGHGHLAGSRALVRVAEVLRRACRAVDTPSRYGGDEFALVLPETEQAAAESVARRVTELLGADLEPPCVSVSLGIGIFPRDADSARGVLDVADHALYGQKGIPRPPAPERASLEGAIRRRM